MTKHIALLATALVGAAFWSSPLVAQSSAPAAQSSPAPQGTQRTRPAQQAPDQYKTEAEAKQRCGTDEVVWANPRSRVFHTSTSKDYGKTRRGAYMCRADAQAARYRAVRPSQKTKG